MEVWCSVATPVNNCCVNLYGLLGSYLVPAHDYVIPNTFCRVYALLAEFCAFGLSLYAYEILFVQGEKRGLLCDLLVFSRTR